MKADENIFRIYLDTVRSLSRTSVYDVYDTLDAFQKRLDGLTRTSATAQRYQTMVHELLREDPRKQGRLFVPYDLGE